MNFVHLRLQPSAPGPRRCLGRPRAAAPSAGCARTGGAAAASTARRRAPCCPRWRTGRLPSGSCTCSTAVRSAAADRTRPQPDRRLAHHLLDIPGSTLRRRTTVHRARGRAASVAPVSRPATSPRAASLSTCFSSRTCSLYCAGSESARATTFVVEKREAPLDGVRHQHAVALGREQVAGQQRANLDVLILRERAPAAETPAAAWRGSPGRRPAAQSCTHARAEESLQRAGRVPARVVCEPR